MSANLRYGCSLAEYVEQEQRASAETVLHQESLLIGQGRAEYAKCLLRDSPAFAMLWGMWPAQRRPRLNLAALNYRRHRYSLDATKWGVVCSARFNVMLAGLHPALRASPSHRSIELQSLPLLHKWLASNGPLVGRLQDVHALRERLFPHGKPATAIELAAPVNVGRCAWWTAGERFRKQVTLNGGSTNPLPPPLLNRYAAQFLAEIDEYDPQSDVDVGTLAGMEWADAIPVITSMCHVWVAEGRSMPASPFVRGEGVDKRSRKPSKIPTMDLAPGRFVARRNEDGLPVMCLSDNYDGIPVLVHHEPAKKISDC